MANFYFHQNASSAARRHGGRELVKKLIARGVGIVAAILAAVSMAVVGATVAHADSPQNKKYSDAVDVVKKWGATPVLSTVTGDVLPLDDCIVTSFSESAVKS